MVAECTNVFLISEPLFSSTEFVYLFSQFDALQNAGFESMHTYDEVCNTFSVYEAHSKMLRSCIDKNQTGSQLFLFTVVLSSLL